MRKLVSVRKITDIRSIEGADKIEQVLVDGWIVVAQKGTHSVGDSVLYFEIDSFLPESDKRFESFMKFGTRRFNDVVGHKVKTVRLRGVYSQGIIMPISEFPEIENPIEDFDYSETIGVVKWEKPEVVGYNGDTKGTFPWFLRKSDQERIQNLYGKLSQSQNLYDAKFVGTLKMDGSSITVFYVEGEKYNNQGWGYCSRNQELKINHELRVSVALCPDEQDVSGEGKFFQGAYNSDLFRKALQLHLHFGSFYAIQGELVGTGIQGNFEKFDTYQVFAYNIFDIEKQEFVDYNTFKQMAEVVDLQIVPEVYEGQPILRESLQDILAMANGTGLKAEYREGIVWKQIDGNVQFKAISNKYLEKQD